MLWSIGQNVIPFLIVITTLVFVHELGHYAVARYYGVHVEAFSIGIGPELFGWTDKRQTRWKISLFPIGGYARFLGDADASSRPDMHALECMPDQDRSQTLMAKTPGQRIAISCAGPAANYLLAFVLFWGLYVFSGQKYTDPVVNDFSPESAAYAAGLQKNDRIIALDDQKIERFEEISFFLKQKQTPDPVQVHIKRPPGEEEFTFIVTPQTRETRDIFGDIHRVMFLGISSTTTTYKTLNPAQAFVAACQDIVTLTTGNLKGFWEMIIGARSTDEMGGPIRIAQMSSKIFNLHDWAPFIWFLGMLSLTLGLINLFPIPMLDGGHVVLHTLEKIKGAPLKEKTQEYAFRVGFFIVGSLMVLALWNDLQKLTFIQHAKNFLMRLF